MKADLLIGIAGACGIPPHEARKCSVRDLELIELVASELFTMPRFGDQE